MRVDVASPKPAVEAGVAKIANKFEVAPKNEYLKIGAVEYSEVPEITVDNRNVMEILKELQDKLVKKASEFTKDVSLPEGVILWIPEEGYVDIVVKPEIKSIRTRSPKSKHAITPEEEAKQVREMREEVLKALDWAGVASGTASSVYDFWKNKVPEITRITGEHEPLLVYGLFITALYNTSKLSMFGECRDPNCVVEKTVHLLFSKRWSREMEKVTKKEFYKRALTNIYNNICIARGTKCEGVTGRADCRSLCNMLLYPDTSLRGTVPMSGSAEDIRRKLDELPVAMLVPQYPVLSVELTIKAPRGNIAEAVRPANLMAFLTIKGARRITPRYEHDESGNVIGVKKLQTSGVPLIFGSTITGIIGATVSRRSGRRSRSMRYYASEVFGTATRSGGITKAGRSGFGLKLGKEEEEGISIEFT